MRNYICISLVFLLVSAGCSLKGNVFSLSVGDCFSYDSNPYIESKVEDVDTVSCSKPHMYEVYSEFELTGSSWPGASIVSSRADEGCLTRFAPFVGIEYDYSEWYIWNFYPLQESWNKLDDRVVTCFLGTEYDRKTTGSARGTRR